MTGRTAVHRDTLVMKCPPKAFPEQSPFIRYYVVYPTDLVYPMTTETSMWVKSLFAFNAKYETKYHER